MNNYLTVNSDEEYARKEHLQERHYQLLNELQTLASEIPIKHQQRIPYELLSNLANCLLDDTIPKIVMGLKDIQHITEKTLFEKRMKIIGKLREYRIETLKENKTAINEGKMTYDETRIREKEMERHIEEETNKIDMKTITELDQVVSQLWLRVSDQQVTLEKAGVPGFFVTNNPNDIQMQMYILEFITKLRDRYNETK